MNSEIFQEAFQDLGSKEHNVRDSSNIIQSFTCHLYGLKKLDDVNQARIVTFNKTYKWGSEFTLSAVSVVSYRFKPNVQRTECTCVQCLFTESFDLCTLIQFGDMAGRLDLSELEKLSADDLFALVAEIPSDGESIHSDCDSNDEEHLENNAVAPAVDDLLVYDQNEL
ncbi:hypothetical protein JTB14_016317 [Gonioctena quinquepunctata]|nr:hypothetical protein JTB14_016317 [Gonioctena quinquepunctata]